MKILVKVDRYSYPVLMDEDGNFRCPHEDVDIEYDRGGDGWTEPGPSWSVYCNDCHNDDMSQDEVDSIVENHQEAQNEYDDYDSDLEY